MILPRPRIGIMILVTVSPVITAFHSCCLSHHFFFFGPSKPLAGLGRIWNRYLLTMLTRNHRDSTPLSAAPRAPKSLRFQQVQKVVRWTTTMEGSNYGDTVTRLILVVRSSYFSALFLFGVLNFSTFYLEYEIFWQFQLPFCHQWVFGFVFFRCLYYFSFFCISYILYGSFLFFYHFCGVD